MFLAFIVFCQKQNFFIVSVYNFLCLFPRTDFLKELKEDQAVVHQDSVHESSQLVGGRSSQKLSDRIPVTRQRKKPRTTFSFLFVDYKF